MEKTAIVKLKTFVCDCARKGQEIAAQIPKARDVERWQLWYDKRNYGWPTRHALLAYAFARGVPYAALEVRVRDGNGPSVSRIEAWLQEAGVPLEAGAVEAWLRGEVKAVAA
jgi:hypothetical protein